MNRISQQSAYMIAKSDCSVTLKQAEICLPGLHLTLPDLLICVDVLEALKELKFMSRSSDMVY